jgi:hypothetical protein
MLFSKAQKLAMNLAADVLSEAKKQEEMYRVSYPDGSCGSFEEREVIYILNDVSIKVTVKAETVTVVKE